MIIRTPERLHWAQVRIQEGTFAGRWYSSLSTTAPPMPATALVFHDDTLSPGAGGSLHLYEEIELVPSCAAGITVEPRVTVAAVDTPSMVCLEVQVS